MAATMIASMAGITATRGLAMHIPLVALAAFVAALSLGLSVATAQTFHGYPCTVDCSGHEAGYEWADRKGIEDPDDCGGNSNSFIEGCQAWAEEQQEQNEDSSADDSGFDE
jgi:hypothetical protein